PTPHPFTVAGKVIDVVNRPGQSKSITNKLSPGSYPFVCTYHQALGMTGTLIVSAPGTKPAPAAVAAAAASAGSSPGAAGPSGAVPGSSASPGAVGTAPRAAGGAARRGAAAWGAAAAAPG